MVLNYTILVFSAKENQYVYLPEMKNIKRKSMFFMTLVAYPFQQSDSHSNREWLNNIPTDIDLWKVYNQICYFDAFKVDISEN